MLKVEYPKPIITASQAKKHLHDLRLQRQNQLTTTINECHRLQNVHKQIYNHQFDSYSIEKPVNHQPKNVPPSPLNPPKYSIPRLEYASVIYRQSKSTFEIEPLLDINDNNTLPIIKELTSHISKSPCVISNDRQEMYDLNQINRSLSAIKHDRQRCLSVSSISSLDKRTHRVYEKWPDYNQISEIVGYRIDPPPPKVITSNIISSRPSKSTNQQKRNSSTKTSTIPKQKKTSDRKLQKNNLASTVINKLPPSPEISLTQPIEVIKPKLPNLLCPSSLAYSQRIRTRQWLTKHSFSSDPIRTLPLL
ncbi:hypothetical protein I4U23_030140 [Adineta vaga]|nr:hypothetical protein I4U23_030140 [Adineta vaga]